MKKLMMYQDNWVFGTGNDGDCIVETDEIWDVSRQYEFNNLTICSGATLRFCGNWIARIKVRCCLDNQWVIDMRRPYVPSCSYLDEVSGCCLINAAHNWDNDWVWKWWCGTHSCCWHWYGWCDWEDANNGHWWNGGDWASNPGTGCPYDWLNWGNWWGWKCGLDGWWWGGWWYWTGNWWNWGNWWFD